MVVEEEVKVEVVEEAVADIPLHCTIQILCTLFFALPLQIPSLLLLLLFP